MSTIITRAEVKKHRDRNNLWLIIHDEVYDVAKFVDEHPGGEDTLLDAAGTDATQAFEDVGHSEDARELLKQYKIGVLPDDEKSKKPVPVCCLDAKRPTVKKSSKSFRNFDDPDGGSALTSKGSKSTRFVVPPDKCDELPTSTAAPSKVVIDKDDRKGSCSVCTSVASCLDAKRPTVKKSAINCRNFDDPDGGSALTSKGSKSTRFMVPPDKCDELPTSTAAPSTVVIDKDDSCMIAHRMTKKENSSRKSSASGKGSCSDCTSASSCLASNRPPVKKSAKNWRNFDEPDGGSALTSKGSKTTRFVVPPDKCDELPTSTAAPSKVVVDKDDRCEKRRARGLPCDHCGGSNWKWYALAALIIGAIAVGAMVVKKNS